MNVREGHVLHPGLETYFKLFTSAHGSSPEFVTPLVVLHGANKVVREDGRCHCGPS